MTQKSEREARLVRIITIIFKAVDASPILSFSISRADNKEADFASRHFKQDRTLFDNNKLLTDVKTYHVKAQS